MAIEEKRAKLFQNGRSQAVRLPKEFRFEGTEVRIRRAGQSIVLEPVRSVDDWFEELDRLGPLDDDAVAAMLKEMPQQKRPSLDKLFD